MISSDRFGRRPVTSVPPVVGGSASRRRCARAPAPRVYPVTLNAVGMTAAALVLLAASRITGNPFVLPHGIETWLAIGYLVVIGSIVVYLLDAVVLRHWAAARAAYGFVIIPFVTVLLSAWLDDKPVTLGLVVGGLLVVVGVHLGALRSGTASRFFPLDPRT